MPYPFSWKPNKIFVTTPSQVTVWDANGSSAVFSVGIAVSLSGVITFTLAQSGAYLVKVRENLALETAEFVTSNTGTSTAQYVSYEAITADGIAALSNYVSLADVTNPTSAFRLVLNTISTNPDHGTLTGLTDDDHPQYLNTTRGDARYLTQTSGDSRYIQTGGALTAADIPFINVKAAPYGATGNGTTDDTAAIQAALDAVPTGGGHVYIPAGRYKISAMLSIKKDNTMVTGAGPGNSSNGSQQPAYGTVLQASGTLSGNPMLRAQVASGARPIYSITLRDFALDGMGTATGAGIHYRSNRGLIDHVYLYRFGSHGFHLQGYSSAEVGNASGWDLYDTVVAFSQASFCGGSGLHLDTGATDMHFNHNIIFNNMDGMRLVGGGSAQTTSCHFYDSTRYNIALAGAGSRSKFVNCKIEGAGREGIILDSNGGTGYSDVQFTGCNITNNGDETTNTYPQVRLAGPSNIGISRTLFSGCAFSTKGGTTILPSYNLYIEAAGQHTTVSGCTFGGSVGTQHIFDNGSSSLPSSWGINLGIPPVITRIRSVSAPATLTLNDHYIRVTGATAVAITVPANATVPLPIGTQIRVRQHGTGAVTLTAASGVTLTGPITGVVQNGSYLLTKIFTDQWDVQI